MLLAFCQVLYATGKRTARQGSGKGSKFIMARRGENIRKRKDGRWEGRYIKGHKPDRAAIWGYVYGRTYTAVKKELTARKNALQTYTLSANSVTSSELSQNWESSISLGVKASTAAHYHYTLAHYILPVLGKMRLQTLNEMILERGLLQIITPQDGCHKPLAHSMAQECLVLVRRICRYAAHLHLMPPVQIEITLPKSTAKSSTVLNKHEQEQIGRYVASAPTLRKAGLLLMMQMGLRIGEVCGLQWNDFDLTTGVLSVKRTVKRIYIAGGRTKVVVQTPKTHSSIRQIPIPKGILQILNRLYNSHAPQEWFLSGNANKPVEPRCYRKSLRSYLHRAGVPTVNPHALRHTFATTCLQAGCNVKTLSELLGHAGSDITMKRYVHTCWDWKLAEMERIFP